MFDRRQVIAGSPLFEGLPEEQLATVARIAQERRYERQQAIFFEGTEATGFYLVAEGKVKVFKLSSGGKEFILHIFGPGEPFGEVPVFHGQPFPANAETLVASTLLFFPRQDFVRLVERTPSLALNMLAVLSLRLRRFAAQIESLSLQEVPVRLARHLLFLAEEQGGAETVDLDIPKGQLASLLGTIPETLSRVFARMSDQGLIRVEGRHIHLLDPAGLRDL
ncbi:MAG: transcriptional regulator [Desulfobulbaceae bacterium A2]|nr:MAG: transcriptional regulator [Desulfobulbaceae bacterium A2]